MPCHRHIKAVLWFYIQTSLLLKMAFPSVVTHLFIRLGSKGLSTLSQIRICLEARNFSTTGDFQHTSWSVLRGFRHGSMFGRNLRVPGCLLEGDKARFGCESCALVRIPFSKQLSQYICRPAPHQASPDLAPLVAGEVVNICLNFKQGRVAGSSDANQMAWF